MQWAIGGCASVLVLVLLSCGIIGVLIYRHDVEYERVVGGPNVNAAIERLLSEYAREVGEGDIADQYHDVYLSRRYKSEHQVGEFAAAEANIRLVDNKRVGIGEIQAKDGRATASMAVEGKNGDRFMIDFVLLREDGLWRVEDFRLRSP